MSEVQNSKQIFNVVIVYMYIIKADAVEEAINTSIVSSLYVVVFSLILGI